MLDELHALAGNKRGDQLALCLSRLQANNPGLRRVGLSATVHDPAALLSWVSPSGDPNDPRVTRVEGEPGAEPEIEILATKQYLPWSGHMALHALPELYERLPRDARRSRPRFASSRRWSSAPPRRARG